MAFCLAPSPALAEPARDTGYCDFVEGAAAATAATLSAPQVFGQVGYVEQPLFAETSSANSSNLRVLGGVRYSFTNLYSGLTTTARARADCKRQQALDSLQDSTSGRALAARIKVYDDAQPHADQILREIETAVETRQATAQELLATRLRVEELRTLAANARRDLAAVPSADTRPLSSILSSYRDADAAIERAEGKLRTIRAYDINVRLGVSRFLTGPNQELQYFGVVELGVNLGALWLGKHNRRAATGRARLARTDPKLLEGKTFEQVRGTLDTEQKLVEQTGALVADLDRQLAAVAQLTGEDGKRFRETLWFAWVKASADLAYQRAHIEALRELVAAEPR